MIRSACCAHGLPATRPGINLPPHAVRRASPLCLGREKADIIAVAARGATESVAAGLPGGA